MNLHVPINSLQQLTYLIFIILSFKAIPIMISLRMSGLKMLQATCGKLQIPTI